jgi:hypothetical protein
MVFWSSTRWVDDINKFWVHNGDLPACSLHNFCATVVKAVPLQAWNGSEGSRKLRFPDFMTTAQDGGQVVSPTHRPPLTAGNTPGAHFY